jgi:hypothetical protein
MTLFKWNKRSNRNPPAASSNKHEPRHIDGIICSATIPSQYSSSSGLNCKCSQHTHSHNHSRRLVHRSKPSVRGRRGSRRSSSSRLSHSTGGRRDSALRRLIGSGSGGRNSDSRKQCPPTFLWNLSSELGDIGCGTRLDADNQGIGRALVRRAGAAGECIACFTAVAP